MMDITILQNLNWHDAPLNRIDIDLEEARLTLTSDLIDPETGILGNVAITFLGVSDLSLKEISQLKDAEVYSVTFAETQDGFKANFLLLAGFGNAGSELNFNFKRFRI